jgi:hypothetical protein
MEIQGLGDDGVGNDEWHINWDRYGFAPEVDSR